MAMNKSFPRTQDLTQSAQRQVQTLMERKDSHNRQVLQDWNTFRGSTITLLSDPATELVRMKVHVFSDSTLCVGVSNPDPSNKWATKLEDAWNKHKFAELLNLAARQVQINGHVPPGASTLDIKKHIQTHLNGRNPESFGERNFFMSIFNDIEWTKKGHTETCLHNAQELAAFATLPWGLRQKRRGGTEISTNPKDTGI